MNQKHVPLRKQSKQKQREYYAARRGDWGGLNPVTRKPPNPKAYNRRKSGPSSMHEPRPGFFMSYEGFYAKCSAVFLYVMLLFRMQCCCSIRSAVLSQRFFQRFQRV